jgi:hypothetical protein
MFVSITKKYRTYPARQEGREWERAEKIGFCWKSAEKKEEKSGLRVEEGRADRLRGLREEAREERAQRSRAKRAEVSGLEGRG